MCFYVSSLLFAVCCSLVFQAWSVQRTEWIVGCVLQVFHVTSPMEHFIYAQQDNIHPKGSYSVWPALLILFASLGFLIRSPSTIKDVKRIENASTACCTKRKFTCFFTVFMCSQCAPGKEPDVDHTECIECFPGFYSTVCTALCLQCPAGSASRKYCFSLAIASVLFDS